MTDDDVIVMRECMEEEHALNTDYVCCCMRIMQRDNDEGAYEREYGRALNSKQNRLEW